MSSLCDLHKNRVRSDTRIVICLFQGVCKWQMANGAVSVHAYRNFTPAVSAFHVTAIPVALLSSSDPQMSCQCMLKILRISRRSRSAPPYNVRFLISKAGSTVCSIAAISSVNGLSLGVFGWAPGGTMPARAPRQGEQETHPL